LDERRMGHGSEDESINVINTRSTRQSMEARAPLCDIYRGGSQTAMRDGRGMIVAERAARHDEYVFDRWFEATPASVDTVVRVGCGGPKALLSCLCQVKLAVIKIHGWTRRRQVCLLQTRIKDKTGEHVDEH
jgi:hypothetical protein